MRGVIPTTFILRVGLSKAISLGLTRLPLKSTSRQHWALWKIPPKDVCYYCFVRNLWSDSMRWSVSPVPLLYSGPISFARSLLERKRIKQQMVLIRQAKLLLALSLNAGMWAGKTKRQSSEREHLSSFRIHLWNLLPRKAIKKVTFRTF